MTFNAGSVNPAALDFSLGLGFYETAQYSKEVDYQLKKTAVGNTLFGKISVPVEIPDAGFVVDKCSVTDNAIATSNVDLVESNCPKISGLDFVWGEESATEVKFQFTSFIFPESQDTAQMSMTCDVSDPRLVIFFKIFIQDLLLLNF